MKAKPGKAAVVLSFFLFSVFTAASCVRTKEAVPRIVLSEGVTLPAITALAWLAVPGGERFVSATADGIIREWDIYSGLVYAAEAGDTASAIHGSALKGTKKLVPLEDGGICLTDADSGKELSRYYASGDEWVSLVPQGFYNAPLREISFLSVKVKTHFFRLDQLAGALFRPDLFMALLRRGTSPCESLVRGPGGASLSGLQSGEEYLPVTLDALFRNDSMPPLVSISSEEGRKLKIKVTEQKGGTGLIAIYSRFDGEAEPLGLFDVETEVLEPSGRKYTEKGKTCYEFSFDVDPGEAGINSVGVSAFNRLNTVESERVWLNLLPEIRESSSLPVLRVFFAAGEGEQESVKAMGEFLSLQAEGDLYSAVEFKSIISEEKDSLKCIQTLDQFCKTVNKNDKLVLYLEGRGRIDELGKLHINEIPGDEIIKAILGKPRDSLLLINLDDVPDYTIETGLLRFRRMLGPKAMFTGFKVPGKSNSFIDAVMEGLSMENLNITEMSFGKNYVDTSRLFAKAGLALVRHGGAFLAFSPKKDFPLVDPFIGAGELRFQTMTSGMLKIDRVDNDPVPLIFGDTMRRTLPPGNYIIDMIYRNGYRETRTAVLPAKGSVWVIFSYTPSLLVGDFSSRLPSLGINLSELNPANYEKINREAMESMGMAPYYVAYLAGEKFYKEGNYDSAIAEYNRSLTLKSDYVESFISRGNAKRRKADYNGAITDYDRALRLKDGNADVYNYRGFAYAQKNDLSRAIDDYTRAIRYRPNYTDAFFNRAYAYGKQGSWDKAIADYTRVIELEPSNASAYNGRGSAWNNKGDEEKAASDFAAAEGLKEK